MFKLKLLILFAFTSPIIIVAQDFLHTQNGRIVNGKGDNIILRGIGTGNWMIQEGYMMLTGQIAGTQHEYRNKVIESIGETKTDSFYNVWLNNHFTRTDLDSMKAWGFNSIRPALHYLWFTPPIEDEPVKGEITWLDKGFDMLDSLMAWCTENEMYLILDMHGAPGGQGENASISDYDPTKPSLWESEENKQKLIALWQKIAERYKNEPWMGGYDLINETNWDFENSGDKNGCNCTSNEPLKIMFEDIIDGIRKVDKNHIVIIEGNCWANNYKGLHSLASYDDNIVFSFHKYWNYNNQESIQWIVDLRKELNVPIWLGESGENSNTWFTNAIRLIEDNNIGWSWWPIKKTRINNVLQVETNEDYLYLLEYWKGNIEKPTEEQCSAALFTWADQHRIENCIVNYDVIDAMLRQPFSTEAIPFKTHKTDDVIYATDYDLGRNGYAYFDTDTGSYHTSTGIRTHWNKGGEYRNDGVDIEKCIDAEKKSNAYNIGWTEAGEWMQYSIINDKEASYTLNVRSASDSVASKFHIEINNKKVTDVMSLPETGGGQKWQTTSYSNIKLPAGDIKLRFVFDSGGSNISYFRFIKP